MTCFRFKCRVIDIQHSCRYKADTEPDHPTGLLDFVEDTLHATKELEFYGEVKSPRNNYQITSDFDITWIERMTGHTAWKKIAGPSSSGKSGIEYDPVSKTFRQVVAIPDIKPDIILSNDKETVVVEIEKSSRKNIWFDFVKIVLLIEQQAADFGLLLVPRNYAHKLGIWDLFREASYYRWCLIQFVRVNPELFSKLAIVGYTQEAFIDGNWQRLDSYLKTCIKKQAESYFQRK